MNDHISKLLVFFDNYANSLIKNNILDNFDLKNINIDYLSNAKKGDVSSNFFLITKKKLIKKDFDIKSDIINKFKDLDFIDKINIPETSFINIFFKKKYLINELFNILNLKQNYGIIKNKKNKKINVEFVSANPTGPIHVAHLRGAVLGDVITSILLKTGNEVTKEYYVNDAGSQIDILGNSLYKRYCQLLKINIQMEKNEYPGEYLKSIAKEIISIDGNKWLDTKDEERLIFFKNFAVKSLINDIKKDLSLLNIHFDKFTYESDIVKSNVIDKLFNILKDQDLIYEGQLDKPKGEDLKDWEPRNQLLFKSSKLFDDVDRSFKKSNGEWTYFANDAAYHYDKYIRKFDKLINIWGADHIGYIPRMKSLVQAISNNNNYLNVLVCQIVKLIKNNEILKMSKREDNFISLREVYDIVGKDPLRYFMISTKNQTPIDFNMNKVIEKNKDNPVFYCQYAFARATSVINKAKKLDITYPNQDSINENFYNYFSEDEIEIILLLLTYPYLLYQTSNSLEPHRITNYLEKLSSSFHSIWNKGKDNELLRFIDENNLEKTQAKLLWIESLRIVLKNAFDIIGIHAPDSM